jgi:AraC-like DNA-binding protein/quercetin dioxygenase-like cupin family protein
MRLVDEGPDDLTDGAAMWVSRFEMRRGDSFGTHVHDLHQVCWTPVGVLTVDVCGARWLLPPSVAIWIPSNAPHDVGCTRNARMHSLYVAPDACPLDWQEPTVVAVGSLLREVIVHLVEGSMPGAQRAHAERLFFDLLQPVGRSGSQLRLPGDARAAAVADGLLLHPADPRTLEEWGREVGASGRTLARQFLTQTGMSFGEWRAHARVHAAVDLLTAGTAVAAVPPLVGYRDPAAFAAVFRRHLGASPAAFARSAG